MKRWLILLSGLIPGLILNAGVQTGTIKGRVYDKTTLEPLAGVYVIYGRNLGIVTGTDGSFLINKIEGNIRLVFRFIGYETETRDFFVGENDSLSVDVGLEPDVSEINQVVISANRTEEKVAELSVSMDIIKSSFLSDFHITDAREIINKAPGIEVLDGQASIRGGSGFSYGVGSRVLVLVDGLPMISSDAGNVKWQFLPLENLSRIEIIKGASSVLYGSSALNGVIDFRTADASNTPDTRFYAETGIYGKPANKDMVWWNSPRIFSSVSFSHLRKAGKTDIGLSINLLDNPGYRKLNDEKLVRTGLKLKHFNGKVEGLNYGVDLTAGYTQKRDFLLWENADSGALKQSVSTATEYHGTFLAVDPFITLNKSNRYRHDLKVRIQTSLNRLPESPGNNSDVTSEYADYQGWFRLNGFLDLTAGITESYAFVKSNFFGNHRYLNLAGFTQVEIRPAQRVKAVAGIRIENNRLDGKNDRFVPVFRAGINWQAAEFTYLRASFGQGYRFPSIAEKFAATTLGSIKIIPNPDLLPESGWSTETGIRQGISAGRIKGQADLSFFLMQNTDMIEYQFDASTGEAGFRAYNLEHARIYGMETELTLNRSNNISKTTITGGYTFMYPVEYNIYTQKNENTYLKYRRMHSGKLSIKKEWPKYNLEVSLYMKSKILNIDAVFLNTSLLPGFDTYWPEHNNAYCVADISAGYNINTRYTLSLTVKNVTNTEYMGRPGDIRPPRNYSLRFSGKL